MHRRRHHIPNDGLYRRGNPAILTNAGMDKGAVFVATCIAAAVSTAVMGLYANYPIALAPMPPSLAPTFLQLDFSRVFEMTFLIAVFSLLIVDIFDNAGTL